MAGQRDASLAGSMLSYPQETRRLWLIEARLLSPRMDKGWRMISKSKLVQAAASAVLSVADVKEYLRVDESIEDLRIEQLIAAATARLESYTNKKFIEQTWDVAFDSLPARYRSDEWWDGIKEGSISELISPVKDLILPFGPLVSVSSFNTYDDDDTAYLFDNSNYSIDTMGPYGKIALKTGAVWPTTVLRPINGVIIQAVFGYGDDPEDVPEPIRTATLQLVAQMFEHRGDEMPKIPAAALMLLEPFREMHVSSRL